jgi:[ribosomal protein S5]-alanine N-acetyltransferase
MKEVELRPFKPSDLLTLIEHPAQFAEQFGLPAADGLRELFVSGEIPAEWVDLLRRGSAPDPWTFGFAVIATSEQQVGGTAAFKGPPDAAGVVEIAYGTAASLRGCGLASSAAAALVAFAQADPRVRTIRAHTLPEPNASTTVLQKCGFEFVGDVIDPDDGPVWRWERRER